MNSIDELEQFEKLTARRKTVKVMSDETLPPSDDRAIVQQLLRCAGWAPFHRPCSGQHQVENQPRGVEPWRLYAIDSTQCRRLHPIIANMEGAGKLPTMLASARALIMATWLPNPPADPGNANLPEHFDPTIENVEHIAATAAAVQSLLLAATAAGVANYWSSGGLLRDPKIFGLLGIPTNQRLLGAVFLFPSLAPGTPGVQIVESKLRQSRGGSQDWSRWAVVGG